MNFKIWLEYEDEELKLRDHVLEASLRLQELNPRMERVDAVRLAFSNAKLHAGIPSKK